MRRLFLQSAQPYRKRSLGVRKEDLDSYSALSCLARRPQKCPNALYHFPTRRAGCARTEPKPKKTRFQDPTFLKLVAHTATVPFSRGSKKNATRGKKKISFHDLRGDQGLRKRDLFLPPGEGNVHFLAAPGPPLGFEKCTISSPGWQFSTCSKQHKQNNIYNIDYGNY